MTRTTAIEIAGVRTYSRWYWFKWRLAKHVHPTAVTEAWYAQDCPPVLDMAGISRRDRTAWAIDKWLHECAKTQVA